MIDLRSYERKLFSQFAEDGMTLELVRRLDPPKTFVEIGASDGEECCARVLAEQGWHGTWVEAHPFYKDLLAVTAAKFDGRVAVCEQFVTGENVASIPVPNEAIGLGVLVIDIDGNDYWVWQTMGRLVRPWIVIIEVNHQIEQGDFYIMGYNPDHKWDHESKRYGASLAAMATLGGGMGYTLVGTTTEGVNAFFVRSDLMAKLDD